MKNIVYVLACLCACVTPVIALPPPPSALIATDDTDLNHLAEFISEKLNVSGSDVELELVLIHPALVERNISIFVRGDGIFIEGEYSYQQLLDVVDLAANLRSIDCEFIDIEGGKIYTVFKNTRLQSSDGVNFNATTLSIEINCVDEKAERKFDVKIARLPGFEVRRYGREKCGSLGESAMEACPVRTSLAVVSREFPIEPDDDEMPYAWYLQGIINGFNNELEDEGISPELRF